MSNLTQPIQPKDPKPGSYIIVTFKNHVWAAEKVGKPVEEVLKAVQEANRSEKACLMRVPR